MIHSLNRVAILVTSWAFVSALVVFGASFAVAQTTSSGNPDVASLQGVRKLTNLVLIEHFGPFDPTRETYYSELAKRGESAIPDLKQALVYGENHEIRVWCARAFADIISQLPLVARLPLFKDIQPSLKELQRIESWNVQRTWVAQALASFAENDPNVPHVFALSENYLQSVKSIGCEGQLKEDGLKRSEK